MVELDEKYKHTIQCLKYRKEFEKALELQEQYTNYLEKVNAIYYEGWMRKWEESESK